MPPRPSRLMIRYRPKCSGNIVALGAVASNPHPYPLSPRERGGGEGRRPESLESPAAAPVPVCSERTITTAPRCASPRERTEQFHSIPYTRDGLEESTAGVASRAS